MSSRIKSISLCEITEPIAQAISSNGGNFSKFVRECLIRYHAATEGSLQCKRGIEFTDNDRLCRPFIQNRCIVCWPAGEPTREDWRKYTKGPTRREKAIHKFTNTPGNHPGTSAIYSDSTHPDFVGWYQEGDIYDVTVFTESPFFNDHSWIQDQARAANPPLFDLKNLPVQGNAKPAKSRRRRRSTLARWLFG